MKKIELVDDEAKDIVNGYVRATQELLPKDESYYIIHSLVIYTVIYFYYEAAQWYSGDYISNHREKCFEFLKKRVKVNSQGMLNPGVIMDLKISTINLKKVVWIMKLNELCLKIDDLRVGFIDQSVLDHSIDYYKDLILVYSVCHRDWYRPYQQQDAIETLI